MNLSDINQPVIPYYSPISSKGGKRRSKTRRHRSRRHKRSNKSRTRRYY